VHADAAVDAFRELGARWELGSALTSRGIAHRLAGRPTEALRDLREAWRICVDLNEKAMITWTAGNLAKAYAEAGDPGHARQVLAETEPIAGEHDRGWTLAAEIEILLAEDEGETARERAIELVEREHAHALPKDRAARVWWTAQVFDEDAAGGAEEVETARKLLEATHYGQALVEPGLAPRR